MFNNDDQQDCQEFLKLLLWQVHEESNKVSQNAIKSADQGTKSTFESYKRWHETYRLKENSAVNELFEGDMLCTITCHACKHRSIYFEKFGELSLNLFKSMSQSNIWQRSR